VINNTKGGNIVNYEPTMVGRPMNTANPYNNVVVNRQAVYPGGPPPPRQTYSKPQTIRTLYAQKTTKNKSFLDMHHYLESIGIKNNEFMLTLIDPDLDGIDPHDPNLNAYYKQKILRECLCNYW